MKKVFCFLCHRISDPLVLTVDYLSSFDENTIIIHIDLKADIDSFSRISEKLNVVFIDERYDVKWGGISMIHATNALLNRSVEFEYDYLFLLSGDDIPCKSNVDINKFLENHGCPNLIHYQDERNNIVNVECRLSFNYPDFFFKKEKNFIDKIKVKAFFLLSPIFKNKEYLKFKSKGGVAYKGSQWFGLNRDAILELNEFTTRNPWFLNMYTNSFVPDESYYHTLIKFLGIDNLYHDKSKPSDALRYTDWKSGPDYPRTLDESDLEKVKESGCLFARKLPSHLSPSLFHKFID